MKLLALPLPAAVVTATLTLPYLALAGTLQTICVALQERYLVHFTAPNLTALSVPFAPKSVPVMVTVGRRACRRRERA